MLASWLAAGVMLALSSGIRNVDFNNFTYPDDLLNGSVVRGGIALRHGSYTFEDKAKDIKLECGHMKIAYGDVGGGQEVAVVPLWCNTGGSGYFTELFVYGIRNNRPALLASLPGGDRGDHGIFQVKIANERLKVVRGDVTEGVCCPDRFAETSYIWNGKSFAAAGVRRFKSSPDQFER